MAPFLIALVLASAPPAYGHAVVVRADPAASSSRPAAPRQVVLEFSEAVEPAFTSAVVRDRSGRQVSEGSSLSSDERTLTVGLPNLPEGIYTVRWRVLSSVDGHTSAGAFAFAVGVAMVAGAAPAAPPLNPVLVTVRWLALLAALLLTGAIFFEPLVLTPALSHLAPQERRAIQDAITRRLSRWAFAMALPVIGAVGAEVMLEAKELLEIGLGPLITGGILWPFLSSTRPGWSAMLRIGTALLLLLPRPLHVRLGWLRWGGAGALLAGFTITSHAAGQGMLASAADWVHLASVGVWVGGLAVLLFVIRSVPHPSRAQFARILVPRFSAVAGIGLGAVVLTGVYAAWLHVPALGAFTVTPYGRVLLTKLLLVVPLVTLGAVNRFVLRPRLATGAGPGLPGAVRLFAHLVSGEVGLAALVLLVVAVLTITPPATVTFPAIATARQLRLAGAAGELDLLVTIAPAEVGFNRYEVTVAGGRAARLEPDARVLFRLMKLDEPLDPAAVILSAAGNGRFTGEGGELGLPGWWQVEVIVRRRGALDVSTAFPLRLGEAAREPSDPSAQRLLGRASEATRRLRSWREVEQLTDGNGNVVVTRYDVLPPDRLRYETSAGTQAVIIGADRFLRHDQGPWEQDRLPQALQLTGPRLYLDAAEQGIVAGRRDVCGEEACQVVLWEGAGAAFAGWIGLGTHRLHRLMMVAPAHYMTLRYFDFDAPIRIAPPQ